MYSNNYSVGVNVNVRDSNVREPKPAALRPGTSIFALSSNGDLMPTPAGAKPEGFAVLGSNIMPNSASVADMLWDADENGDLMPKV